MKKIIKLGTGDTVPHGAKYFATIANERMPCYCHIEHVNGKHICNEKRYVWHYFLVDEE